MEARTGISREAIHFYLREGLLPEPERPKRNVAYYCEEHVVRIRAIKQLQQQRGLPLEAIKPLLQEFDYQAMQTQDDLGRFELTVQAHVNGELPAHNQRLADVVAETGLSETALLELAALGVIRVQGEGDRAELDFSDVAIVRLWANLQAMGFDEANGYDAAYLKRFADAVAPIAESEVHHFLGQFGDLPIGKAAQLAAEGIAITKEILTRLRTQAIMRTLHRRVHGGVHGTAAPR